MLRQIFAWTITTVTLALCFGADYKEAFHDQIIDHFNFKTLGNRTFKQRYLYNDSWWERGSGPIFFYVGNEIPVDRKWYTDRFVAEIAPSHKAFILFVEHRYYGKSLPFGNDSFKSSNIGWLSIEQTLADYAFFLEAFKRQFNAEDCPVIAFGASYGGMLAAFMRFKYPNLIHGVIAASAPIFQLEGITKADLYFQAATEAFRSYSEDCVARIRSGYQELDSMVNDGKSAQGPLNNVKFGQRNSTEYWIWPENKKKKALRRISDTFRLCTRMETDTDYDRFLRWTRNLFVNSAMKNNPYPIDPLPALPVKVMCERSREGSSPSEGLRSAIDLYFNISGNEDCFDYENEFMYCSTAMGCIQSAVFTAWDYQACTENNLEGDSNGVTDMFPVLPFTSAMRDEYCKKRWNVTPRRDLLKTVYWGKDISLSSNIVFSNGVFDPWAPGGVLKNASNTVLAIIIDNAAHHLDFRAAHPNDPQSVIDARNFEVGNIQKWINDYHKAKEQSLEEN